VQNKNSHLFFEKRRNLVRILTFIAFQENAVYRLFRSAP